MSEENKIRDAADAIKGVLQAVPVYQDVAQPALKEVGTALQTVTKTIHIALAPISALVWGYEKISDYLNVALAEKLKYVPPERIITPNPAVAGPTVEALRFAAGEPSLREMYANLLATSMDSSTAQNAHPAFVEIIRQLTVDEARIVAFLNACGIFSGVGKYTYSGEYFVGNGNGGGFRQLAVKSDCIVTDLAPSYIDNLHRLGLISIQRVENQHVQAWVGGEYAYGGGADIPQPITEKELVQLIKSLYETISETHSQPVWWISMDVEHLSFTSFGKQFCNACLLPINTE